MRPDGHPLCFILLSIVLLGYDLGLVCRRWGRPVHLRTAHAKGIKPGGGGGVPKSTLYRDAANISSYCSTSVLPSFAERPPIVFISKPMRMVPDSKVTLVEPVPRLVPYAWLHAPC